LPIKSHEEHSTIYDYYVLLTNLFHVEHALLYAAQQSGSCGRHVLHCRYLVNYLFVREPSIVPFVAPVAGLGRGRGHLVFPQLVLLCLTSGSPTEEAVRLVYELLRKPLPTGHCDNMGFVTEQKAAVDTVWDYLNLNLWPQMPLWYFCTDKVLPRTETDKCTVVLMQ
jgi:hypothetical protein